jgi:hypothetical protein
MRARSLCLLALEEADHLADDALSVRSPAPWLAFRGGVRERKRLIDQCEPLSGRLQLSREGNSALFQPVADHVDRLAAI